MLLIIGFSAPVSIVCNSRSGDSSPSTALPVPGSSSTPDPAHQLILQPIMTWLRCVELQVSKTGLENHWCKRSGRLTSALAVLVKINWIK